MKIILFTVFVLAVACAFILWKMPGFSRRGSNESQSHAAPVDQQPDNPIPFGYKSAWIAVETIDTEKVVACLSLKNVSPSNWENGLRMVRKDFMHSVFVSPPVDGWTFVVGSAIGGFDSNSDRQGEFLKFLAEFGRSYPEFFFFATHRVSGYHAWAKVESGTIIRAYAYVADSGMVLYAFGDLTESEDELGFNFVEKVGNLDDLSVPAPNEDDVMKISRAWSIDTLSLSDYPISQRLGVTGTPTNG